MPDALPLDPGRRDPAADLAYVHVLRSALRGDTPDGATPDGLRSRYDRAALLRALGRIERLLADEWSRTLERARALLLAALAGSSVGRTA